MSTPGTILLVEDHADLAENLAEILEEVGYRTVVAGSAEEALRTLPGSGEAQPGGGDLPGATARFDALVTDFRLPGLSGADLIQELRRRGVGIPAVVMSAHTDDETILASRRAGANEVLAKPVVVERLLTTIALVLGRRPGLS